MNGSRQGYQNYRRDRWDDDASSRPTGYVPQLRRIEPSYAAPFRDIPKSYQPRKLRSSAYEGGNMSPYRGEVRGHHGPPQSNGYSSNHGSIASGEDGPTYVLEHLATFKVSSDSGLMYPADGMRRLLHMEKTTGIWTQKMFLKLERKWVFILAHENGDVVEKFPMELIREPTAFTSEDPKELYNNIFIFVVAQDDKRKYDNDTEMHIFQCLRISAKDVVEDMKLYMSGKSLSGGALRGGRGEQIPPAPQEPAPVPPLVANGYRDYSDGEARGDARLARSEMSSVSHNDEVSSTSSERYERDVAILNNCFDDIERFIARLQHTAAATKELERRRRSRKSKKKDIGDGLLSMRAKPPPEREFIDIFQKFKLSFNLLAKLRAHIRDPNAPELVHFLFTPLALITEASRDSFMEPGLPPKVESPLLTQDAVELLTNCLTSRETELWQSLGEAWLIPKEHWKFHVPGYRPVFYSGWAPEVDERDRRYPMYPDRNEADPRQGGRDEFDYAYDSDRRETSPPPSDIAPHRYRRDPRDERARSNTPLSEYPHDDIEAQNFEKSQRKWLEDLKARHAKIVQVTYPRTANNDKELTVVRGEYLEVVDDSRKWWKAMNSRGQTAHVPHTIVTPFAPEHQADPARYSGPPRPTKKDPHVPLVPAVLDYDVMDEDIPSPPPPPGAEIIVVPEPRPPRPVASQNIFGTTKSHADLMNEELKWVLDDFRKSRPHLEINKTPDVYIKQSSTPEEIQKWLALKGFSERIQKQFDGVDGERLFSLSRKQLESFCGKTEGSRLDSQVNIQKSVSGYKTVRSTELKHILAQQRKKLDTKGQKKPTEYSVEPDYKNHIIEVPKQKTEDKPMRATPIRSPSKYVPKAPIEKDEDSVSANFNFLKQYETVEIDIESDGASSEDNISKISGGSLRDQIRNQQRKIVRQPNQVITSR